MNNAMFLKIILNPVSVVREAQSSTINLWILANTRIGINALSHFSVWQIKKALFQESKHAINAEHWVVNVPHGSDRARRLAEDHGLNFLGEVIPDTNLFHFSGKDHHPSKRDLADLHQRLSDHPGNPLDILANLVVSSENLICHMGLCYNTFIVS